MATELELTRAQFDALHRLDLAMADRAHTKTVRITRPAPGYVRVTFDAGWGTAAWDVDLDGCSEFVAFGVSDISIEHRGVRRVTSAGRAEPTASEYAQAEFDLLQAAIDELARRVESLHATARALGWIEPLEGYSVRVTYNTGGTHD